MTKTKFLTIAVIILLILNGFLLGSMLMHKKHKHGLHGPKELVIKKLAFDNTQIMEFKELMKIHKTSVKDLNDQIFNKKKELYQTLKTPNSEESEKDALNDLDSLQSRAESLHLNHFKDIRKMCKDDSQIEKFNSLTDEIQRIFHMKRKGPKK